MRALLSVYDKTGIVELARELQGLGWDLISSGGTAKALRDADLAVTDVADLTGTPAILGHRVVTLHPKVHGGILADRRNPDHQKDMAEHGIEPIDLVVSNLYPFGASLESFEHGASRAEELIDIGGPAMIRAAAKNFRDVGILTHPSQYQQVVDELKAGGVLSDDTKRQLARTAFAHTAAYDAAIVGWFDEVAGDAAAAHHPPRARARAGPPLRREPAPDRRPLPRGRHHLVVGRRGAARRHGAQLPQPLRRRRGVGPRQRPGHDVRAAGRAPSSSTPTRAARRSPTTLPDAYQRAFECDERSAFGGIVALSHPVDDATVERMVAAAQADVVIAPGYGDGVIEALAKKRKNTRLLDAPRRRRPTPTRSASSPARGSCRTPTTSPSTARRLARRHQARADRGRVGRRRAGLAPRRLGEEQLDRPGEGRHRVGHRRRPAEPGRGRPDRRVQGGRPGQGRRLRQRRLLPVPRRHRGRRRRRASPSIIQPGGSVKDEDNIAKADELGVAMVFTGERHFLH